MKKTKITAKMTFAEILEKHPESAEFFIRKGMHCIGCPMAQMESLEDGCKAHGLKVNEIIKELNKKK